MNPDPLFLVLDDWLATAAAQLAPGQRRQLTRNLASGLRQRQQQRIHSQKNPGGEGYTPRRHRVMRTHGGIRFLWKGEVRELKNWRATGRRQQRAITGYDVNKGALRTFYRRDIRRYIEIHLTQTRRVLTRKEKMFRRLRTARFLRARGDASAAVVGFSGHTAEIASIHQYGEVDTVAPGARTRYPARELLGFTDGDADWLAATVVSFLHR